MTESPASPAIRAPDVARHYDELDPYYRELWGEHVHHGLWNGWRGTVAEATEALVRHVAVRAGIRAGTTVCDVGSGYGASARLLAREYGACVTAITVSATQHRVALAAERVVPAPDYRLADFVVSALPGASFDAAIAVESLSHMPDLPGTLAEVRRIVRHDGRFVACVWLAGDGVSGWRRSRLLEPIVTEGRLARLATAGELEAALGAAGFLVEHFEDLTPRVRHTWTAIAARVVRRLAVDAEARRTVAAGGEAVFARTIARIWLAYRVGAMRYGVFTARAVGP